MILGVNEQCVIIKCQHQHCYENTHPQRVKKYSFRGTLQMKPNIFFTLSMEVT